MNREEFKSKMNPLPTSVHPTLRPVLYAQTSIHIATPEKQLATMEWLIEEFSEVNKDLKAFDELRGALRLINEVANV